MNLFLSDLDNTLIYSYKKEIGREKVLVESKDGKELSFMTKKSMEILCEVQKKISFIPVTTRSMEQYRRIQLSDSWTPQYSLVANGGILLCNNVVVEKWYEGSLELIAPTETQLKRGAELLSQDKNITMEPRRVDGLFVFTKSDEVGFTLARLKENLDEKLVDIFHNGSKIYVVPKVLNKGTALERIKNIYQDFLVLAAGDSVFDVPMLEKADISFMPKNLEGRVRNHINHKIVVEEELLFSDVLLESIRDQFVR